MRPVWLVLMVSLLMSGPLTAKSPHAGPEGGHPKAGKQAQKQKQEKEKFKQRKAAKNQYELHDRPLIEMYFREPGKGLPPGLAKRDRLPPGLAKKSVLPKGLQGMPLPPSLELQLTPIPPTHMRLMFGPDIVVVHKKTREVLEILRDTIPRPPLSPLPGR